MEVKLREGWKELRDLHNLHVITWYTVATVRVGKKMGSG